MGTKFTVYDSGTNPSKNPGALLEESATRQELAAICYVSELKRHTHSFIILSETVTLCVLFGRKPTFWASKDHVR